MSSAEAYVSWTSKNVALDIRDIVKIVNIHG